MTDEINTARHGRSLPVRHLSREWAVQVLYQADLAAPGPPDDGRELTWDRVRENPGAEMTATEQRKVRRLAEEIVQGVLARRAEIDALLEAHAENWTVTRMGAIDRNVMRLAVYEMLDCPDIPAIVSIDEAIEIAKKYGDIESSRFVNAILDRVHRELEGGQ